MSDFSSSFSLLVEKLPKPVVIYERSGVCRYANNEALQLLQASHVNEIELRFPWFGPDDAKSNRIHQEADSEELATTLVLGDGSEIVVRLALFSLSAMFAGAMVMEVAPKSEDPATLHLQRLETLGMLAGGVAHDFNNLLTGILGHITFLKTILPGKGPHIESLDAIEHGAKRSSSITQQILDFAKQEEQEPLLLDLSEVMLRTCKLLKGALPPQFSLQFSPPENPLVIRAVEGVISQVIVNLVVNARDAIDGHGIIEVGIDEQLVEPEYAAIQGEKCARLFVRDNGRGMASSTQQRIFDPFFSTKQGKGTGLGLTTVHAIVQRLKGRLEFQSEEGKGTAVSVYIPLASSSSEDELFNESPYQKVVDGQGRILVIDDEELVRNVLSVSLHHLGYQVSIAASGMEALGLLKSAETLYDLVLLDMVMPGVGGEEVFQQIRMFDPSVPVLLISGMCVPETLDGLLAHPRTDFLKKPFTIQDLSVKVCACINADEYI